MTTPHNIPLQRSKWVLTFTLINLFGGGAVLGLGMAWWLAPGSAVTQFIGFLYLPLIMGTGYQLWRAQVIAMFMGGLMKKGLSVLWQMFFKKQKVDLSSLLPTREQAGILLEYAYKKASVFITLSIFISLPVSVIAGFAAPQGQFLLTFTIFFVVGIGYGVALTRLARSGYLMLPE